MAPPIYTFSVPQVTETGATVPTYETIHEELREAYRSIYGDDVYLDEDSQDGQWLALIALALFNYASSFMAVYNAFSPSTAEGVGLSRNVKINGIRRNVATFSSVDLKLIGQAGTTIEGGYATDTQGTRWLLPDVVSIPDSGEITVTALSAVAGSFNAAPNTITEIATPTRGWQEVTNPAAAVPGSPVETDTQLRLRQSVSTMIPSQTVFEGIIGAVANVDGVTRWRAYENDTSATDSNGIPAHTVAFVVEGGLASEVAAAIARKKTPGTRTTGTTSVIVTDAYGIPRTIQFYRPTSVRVLANIRVRPKAGYTATVEDKIKDAVAAFINEQPIGEDIIQGRAYLPADLWYEETGRDPLSSTYEIVANGVELSRDPATPTPADVNIAFNEAAFSSADDVTIEVVA